MKDLRLIIRLKNNHLLKAREGLRFSQIQMADYCGIGIGQYQNLENLTDFPIDKAGNWKEHAMSVSSALHIEPENIWPESFANIKNTRTQMEVGIPELAYQESILLEGPEQFLNNKELQEQTDAALDTLTDREKKVLRERFGILGEEKKLSDVGADLIRLDNKGRPTGDTKVSLDRARMIEAKALRKLRHPSRSKLLKPFID